MEIKVPIWGQVPLEGYETNSNKHDVNGDLGMLVAMSQQLRQSNLATTQKHYAAIKQETVNAKLRDAWKNSALNLGKNAVNTDLASIEKSGQGGI